MSERLNGEAVKLPVIGKFMDGRLIYRVPQGVPGRGYIAFGVIDRGTNVLQVRPTTICPQNCVFCSVDAGLRSRSRWAEFIVDQQVIVEEVTKAVEEKECNVEVLLDTVGDVLTYPDLPGLVKSLKSIRSVKTVALETHGMLLTRTLVDKLAEAGLDRINLSIETLNLDKAKVLYGTPAYDLRRVIDVIEYTIRETPIDVHVTPVLLPGINEDDVVEVIKWAIRVGAGKKWPPVTVQKFIKHKYGRGRRIAEMTWSAFWNYVEKLERELGVKLRWTMNEWGMHYAKRISKILMKGDLVTVHIIARGWLRGEYLGLYDSKTLLAVNPGKYRVKIQDSYVVRVVEDKDELYIAEIVGKPQRSTSEVLPNRMVDGSLSLGD
ncbi:MAG: radical SAM protein [Desulfurococcaceae archaeon]